MNINLVFLNRKASFPMAVAGASGKNYGNSQYLNRHAAHVLSVPAEKWTAKNNEMAIDVTRGNAGGFIVLPVAEIPCPSTSTLSTSRPSTETPTIAQREDAPDATPFGAVSSASDQDQSLSSKENITRFSGLKFKAVQKIARDAGVPDIGGFHSSAELIAAILDHEKILQPV